MVEDGQDSGICLQVTSFSFRKTLSASFLGFVSLGLMSCGELQQPDRILSVEFSHNGQFIASGGYQQTVYLYDLMEGGGFPLLDEEMYQNEEIGDQLPRSHLGRVNSVLFIPNRGLIATGGGDGVIKIWDQTNQKVKACIESNSRRIYSLDISPTSSQLKIVSGGGDGTVKIWDLDQDALKYECGRDGEKTWSTFVGQHFGQVNSVVFSRDGQKIASSGVDGYIKIWHLNFNENSWNQEKNYRVSDENDSPVPIYSLSFSPDGNQLVSGDAKGQVSVWDLTSQSNQPFFSLSDGSNPIYAVAHSYPDGGLVASGGYDGMLSIWDIQTRTRKSWTNSRGETYDRLVGHTDWIWAISYNPEESNQIASGSWDSSIIVWDIEQGVILYPIGESQL